MAQRAYALRHVSKMRDADSIKFSRSNSSGDQHDEQYDDKQAGNAAGSVTPAAAMAPGWQGTDQDQYQYDEQDCSDSHDFSL